MEGQKLWSLRTGLPVSRGAVPVDEADTPIPGRRGLDDGGGRKENGHFQGGGGGTKEGFSGHRWWFVLQTGRMGSARRTTLSVSLPDLQGVGETLSS